MITPTQRMAFEQVLRTIVVQNASDSPRERLIRACVAFWEKSMEPIVGASSKTGVRWSMPRAEYIELWDREVAKLRGTQRTKFAESSIRDLELRHVGVLPESLFIFIEQVFEAFENNPLLVDAGRPFSNDSELTWFYREFPRYRVAEKV